METSKKEIMIGKKRIQIFETRFNKDDQEIIEKINKFAEKSFTHTYRRSKMNDEEHMKNIVIGKMAEYAFSQLIKRYLNKDIEPSFENKVDMFDFNINGLKIDIKSSSMKTKRRVYSTTEALSSFNFTVLRDQSLKDIIVQALYPSRENYSIFYFSVWQYVDEVIKEGEQKKIGWGDYYLLPLINGNPLIRLFDLLKWRR